MWLSCIFLVGFWDFFASFATFLNVYKGLGVIKSTCSQHFHHFIAGLQRFWRFIWHNVLGYTPIWRSRPRPENAFFWPRGVPIPTFPPRFLAFYDANYDATTTATTDVLLPERDHQTELSTLMLITIVGTNNHWHSREMSYFYCWRQDAMLHVADCPTNYPEIHAARFTVNVIWMSSLTIPRARSLYSKIVYCVTHWYSRTYRGGIIPTRFTWKKFKS